MRRPMAQFRDAFFTFGLFLQRLVGFFQATRSAASKRDCASFSSYCSGSFAMPRKPWVPRPEEARFSHEYLHRRRSSQNDHDYMVLGGIVVPLAFAAQLEKDIDTAKPENFRGLGKDRYPREVGWKLTSKGSFARYKKIIDAYADFAYRNMQGVLNAGKVQMFYSVVDLRLPGRTYTGGERGSIAFERELYIHCVKDLQTRKRVPVARLPRRKINRRARAINCPRSCRAAWSKLDLLSRGPRDA